MTRKRLQVSRRKIATTNLGAHCSTILFTVSQVQINCRSILDREYLLLLDSQDLEEKKAFLLFLKKDPSRAPGILFYCILFLTASNH
jgi:hypothetical protein